MKREKKRVIYYNNWTLVGYDLNYTLIQRASLVVIFASQKLQHYMLKHKIKLIARIEPLKYLLNKATFIGRLAKWVMIFNEFGIEYVEKKATKGQVIVDQLVEALIQVDHLIISDLPNELVFTLNVSMQWKLYFDGSYTRHGLGVGILFIKP